MPHRLYGRGTEPVRNPFATRNGIRRNPSPTSLHFKARHVTSLHCTSRHVKARHGTPQPTHLRSGHALRSVTREPRA